MDSNLKMVVGNEPWQRAASIYVRMTVFVLERSLAMQDEFDANDTEDTVYAVLYDQNLPIATGRFLREDDDTARLTRIATLKEYRGKQLGAAIKLR